MSILYTNNFSLGGYQILPQIIDARSIDLLNKNIDEYVRHKAAYGIRDLHLKIPLISELASSTLISNILQKYTDQKKFKLIKAIFFNKNNQHNWAVSWHQDKTIAVKNKAILNGYKNWTMKQGVNHVQPPLKILEKIATIRVALDDTDINNGALKVIPRSHNLGVLKQAEIDRFIKQKSARLCSLKAGDVLMMHPLILHSSAKSKSNRQRRIIHLEYSSVDLPQPLTWY